MRHATKDGVIHIEEYDLSRVSYDDRTLNYRIELGEFFGGGNSILSSHVFTHESQEWRKPRIDITGKAILASAFKTHELTYFVEMIRKIRSDNIQFGSLEELLALSSEYKQIKGESCGIIAFDTKWKNKTGKCYPILFKDGKHRNLDFTYATLDNTDDEPKVVLSQQRVLFFEPGEIWKYN